ncbi:hypothetical protein GUJ93_ZPchr0006g41706 [Zizania palustris]|uniref:Uncharacterized protein n=1 Tax=Zizania palustris TaxID=103762 RepID=A0A8J5SIX2_ZIZPA|nr:hypothetical protein GUJ93_ZPchr0006g41706 [Zizania palustris]
MHPSSRSGHQPIQHNLYLSWVHGDTIGRYDMTQVGDIICPKLALRTLDEETVSMKNVEDSTYVMKVICSCSVVYEDIIKENENEPSEEGPEYIVHEGLECGGALHNPNGITKNS